MRARLYCCRRRMPLISSSRLMHAHVMHMLCITCRDTTTLYTCDTPTQAHNSSPRLAERGSAAGARRGGGRRRK
eukprot:2874375-Rhodomonas_salina.1